MKRRDFVAPLFSVLRPYGRVCKTPPEIAWLDDVLEPHPSYEATLAELERLRRLSREAEEKTK